MPNDVFNRAGNDFQGSFASDGARIVFGSTANNDFIGPGAGAAGAGGVGLLTQQLSVQYQQAISRLYEIGTNFTYLVAGRAQGQVSLQRVLGPRAIQLAFYTKYGDICNASQNNINFEADTGCGQSTFKGYAFGVRNVVITNLGITVGAQEMVINEQLAMMFVSLTTQEV